MSTNIQLCRKCEGRGFKWKEDDFNYHTRTYERVWREDCPACEGCGRVKVTTVTTTTAEPLYKKGEKA